MRNLRILQDLRKRVNGRSPVTATAWDPSADCIIFTQGPSPSQQVIDLRRIAANAGGSRDQSTLIASWDAPCPIPELDCDAVLDLHHFPHTETTCLILAGGDIVHVRHNARSSEEKIEIVGSVDEGISAASWSPDEDLLVIATRANTVLFMTADYECLVNVTPGTEDAKLSKHVSVGWGKVETQFKGKRARALRDPTVPERVDEGVLSPRDGRQTTISWRGDGAYVAINSILDDVPRRMIRVYSREGVLDSVTEPVDGLEGCVSWRPAGNLIAGLQRLDGKASVVFFERNGLRHGEFSLRLSAAELDTWASSIDLAWNNDSSALAVCLKDRMQIWTMSNYHYYLKQEIRENEADHNNLLKAVRISWHPEDSLRFVSSLSPLSDASGGHDVLTSGSHDKYWSEAHQDGFTSEDTRCTLHSVRTVLMTSTVSRGTVMPPGDNGTVVVIDGKTLKITPLRSSNVPPPMSLYDIELESPVKDVSVDESGHKIAALHDRLVTFMTFDPASATQPCVTETVTLPISGDFIGRQLSFNTLGHVLVLCTDYDSGGKILHRVVPESSSTHREADQHTSVPADGQEFVVPEESMISNIRGLVQTETACGVSNLIFRLTSNGSLYANERQLVRNCTSFVVTQSHAIFTTVNHLLKFVHLTSAANDLEIPGDSPESDERCRSIERGAKIVTVMPSTYSLVLQMPRGNLETIFPRALVLAKIRQNILDREYRKAFLTCRSQRVDMNILHDYLPDQFLSSVELIIHQLRTVEYLDLLLSQLNESDVSQTLYRETLRDQTTNGDEPISNAIGDDQVAPSRAKPGKVNRICDAFLSILQHKYGTHLQTVITANVCKVPPNIEAGLEIVASLREENEEQAESALEHMCFLTDVNQVYERALGVYDLDLALMVAQQSQKDPREYLPYLQSLHDLEPLRRKFAIDNDLKRYSKSLRYLQALDAFDELKSYVQKHDLYSDALEMYRYSPIQWRSILRLQADFFASRNRYSDAGIAFESLGDLAAALSAYNSAGTWRPALTVASMIPVPPDELQTLASSFLDTALESKDFPTAASICLDYLSDTPNAVTYLCRAYKPTEALRLAARNTGLLTTHLEPGLIEATAALTELLADCKSQAIAQSARLVEVRTIKTQDPLRFLGDGDTGAGGGDIPDDISLAPTGTSVNPSLFTRYSRGGTATGTLASNVTRKTSKNARREERKRARGKKGSVYEEEYLVNSFERLVNRVNEATPDVKEVAEVCARRGGELWERGAAVQRALDDVRNVLTERIVVVFETTQDTPLQAQALDEEESVKRMGGDRVLWDAMEGAKAKKVAPVLKPFDRLQLLA